MGTPEIHAAIPCSAEFVGAMDPTGVADGSYMDVGQNGRPRGPQMLV